MSKSNGPESKAWEAVQAQQDKGEWKAIIVVVAGLVLLVGGILLLVM